MHCTDRPLLAQRTTLRLGGPAQAEIGIVGDADWDAASRFLERTGGIPFALGRGSNVLAAAGPLPHVLVRDCRPLTPVVEGETDAGTVGLRVGAGMPLPRLLGWLHAKGLSGLEGVVGIPGTLGGAVAMNAGSYATEMAHVVRGVEIWTPQGGRRWLDSHMCQWDYRRLRILQCEASFYLITGVRLEVTPDVAVAIRRRMAAHYRRKRSTQPVLAWTCGCVFCNPSPQQPAGKLLDACGLRGARQGQMAFSAQHANFLVNLGKGTSAEAGELLALARQRVAEQYGEKLRLEVCCLQ